MAIMNVRRGTLGIYTVVFSSLFVGCVLPEYGRSETGEAGRTGIGGGSSSGSPSSQAAGSTRNSSSNNRGGAGGRSATDTENGGSGNRESTQTSNGGTSAPASNGGATAGGQTSQPDTSDTGPQSGGASTTSSASNSVSTGGQTSNSTGGVTTTGGTSSKTTVATGGRVTSTTTTTSAPVTGGTGTGGSTSACSAGAKDCANGVPRTCVNGQWQTQTACASNQTCKAGQCVCTSGTKQCKSDGVTTQTCTDSGTWQEQACGGQTPYCYGAGTCAPCQEGSKRCNDNTPQLCSSGAWKDQTVCAGTTPVCTGNGVCGCPPSGGGPTMVGVPSGFCIDSTEVTRAQYAAWLRTNPTTSGQVVQCSSNSSFAVDATCMENPFTCKADCDGHPQICIDWCDAYAYCKAAGKRLCGKIGGGPNNYNDNLNVTRSQLYAACTSNGANDYTYGDTFTDGVCNVYETLVFATVTAGSMSGCQSPTSGFKGIYDLTGNVAEWEDSCESSAAASYCRVRGGDYVAMGDYESCSVDASSQRNTASPSNGFRCCSP